MRAWFAFKDEHRQFGSHLQLRLAELSTCHPEDSSGLSVERDVTSVTGRSNCDTGADLNSRLVVVL